ncbi:MAG: ABC transporter ATP-binding protein [Lachnospiraceae bacterium]|nr:ABC transporter ATP-binding protein [Lachnospiraceae bacterium]
MSLIACDKVSFSYEKQIVVNELSFSIEKGDYLCIIGENGTGKTTLVKGLLGLKKPSGGKITVGDSFQPTEIGYVPQQTVAQKDFPASVYEVVISGCLNQRGMRPGYSKENKERANSNMELLGISDLRKKCYRNLSGGQQQRVLLARSLCATTSLLLLDEPTTGLDPVATTEFYSMIDRLNKKHGITIVMVSHAIKEAIEHAGSILHLSHSSYFYGTVEAYRHSTFGKRFLGGMEDDHIN